MKVNHEEHAFSESTETAHVGIIFRGAVFNTDRAVS